ncbi:MAG: hypothetical protein K2X03_19665 [Bryobacteraceae bacterium]|nr:hypothetical protein [Bryobacteraceae bacterium]
MADQKCPDCVCSGVGPELSRAVRQALNVPEAANEHFRNASVEVLKGLRELLDHRIEKMSRPDASRGTKLAVD